MQVITKRNVESKFIKYLKEGHNIELPEDKIKNFRTSLREALERKNTKWSELTFMKILTTHVGNLETRSKVDKLYGQEYIRQQLIAQKTDKEIYIGFLEVLLKYFNMNLINKDLLQNLDEEKYAGFLNIIRLSNSIIPAFIIYIEYTFREGIGQWNTASTVAEKVAKSAVSKKSILSKNICQM